MGDRDRWVGVKGGSLEGRIWAVDGYPKNRIEIEV